MTTAGARLCEALDEFERTPARAPTHRPLSASQLAVAALLASGFTHEQIALRLGCARSSVRSAIEEGAARIPSDLPASSRLVAWYRGAGAHVLGPERVAG